MLRASAARVPAIVLRCPDEIALPASTPTATFSPPEFEAPPKAPEPTAVLFAPVPASKANAPIAVLLLTSTAAAPALPPPPPLHGDRTPASCRSASE